MRLTSIFFCFLLAGIFALNCQEQVPDSCVPARTDYGIDFVSSAFQYYGDSYDKHTFHKAKNFTNDPVRSLYRFGDGVSIAVLKICPLDELVKPRNASAYLTLASLGFSDRSKVLEESDREPKVTYFVLDYLEQKESADSALMKRIIHQKTCTKDFTCSDRN